MSAIAIAIGALLVAALEVAALVVILLTLAVVTYGVVLGIRRSRPTSSGYGGYFRPGVGHRLGAGGVPRQLGLARESTLGGRLTFERATEFDGHHLGYEPSLVIFDEAGVTFDGHAIGERLDHDVPGCDR